MTQKELRALSTIMGVLAAHPEIQKAHLCIAGTNINFQQGSGDEGLVTKLRIESSRRHEDIADIKLVLTTAINTVLESTPGSTTIGSHSQEWQWTTPGWVSMDDAEVAA